MNKIATKFRTNPYIRLMRPVQWSKNLSLSAALIFSGKLLPFNELIWSKVFFAMIIFSILSSCVYILNDIVDIEKDRNHPTKKFRPLANSEVSIQNAGIMGGILLGLSLSLAVLLNRYFFTLALGYVILQLTYSFYLKNIIIIDAMSVAMGFIFRVYAGAVVIESPISSWLINATIGLSLLMAFGKRLSEKTILAKNHASLASRSTLSHYPDSLLNSMISITATLTILSYINFAFQSSPIHYVTELNKILPSTLLTPKWLLLTVPIVLYGVARYLYVIYEKGEGESPEKVLITDKPLLFTILVWGFSIIAVLYFPYFVLIY